MKKLLLSIGLAAFATANVFAQTGEPVSDTSYLVRQGNLFFEVKTATYADASELTTKTLVGDTAALVEAAKARLTSKSATMAVDIRYVSTYRRQFTELLREANAVQALTGIDPQRTVQDEYSAPFLTSGWTVKRDGAVSGVEFSLNAQGALRFSVAGAATKSALLIGNALRLKNYPSNGVDTDLFILPNGVWVDATRSVVLRPPNNDAPVSRAVSPAPTKTKKGN